MLSDSNFVDLMRLQFNLIAVSLIGVSIGGISTILQHSFSRGNIFQRWLPFVAKMLLKETPELSQRLRRCVDREEMEDIVTELAITDTFWYKPLGGCGVCMNVWICFLYAVVVYSLTDISILTLPVMLGVAGFSFRLLNR